MWIYVIGIGFGMNTIEGAAFMLGTSGQMHAFGWPLEYQNLRGFYPANLAADIAVVSMIALTLGWVIDYALRVTFPRP